MSRAAVGVALLTCLAAGLAGCGERSIPAARDRALTYFATQVHEIDHGWSSIFDHLQRRFGLEVRLADGRTLHGVHEVARPEAFQVSRRLLDPNALATRRQIADLPTPIDRITATGLHCDHIGLPEDWVAILRKASRAGAYALTHAVLAQRWTLENGCLPEIALVPLQAEQVDLLVALLEDPDALAERYALATDIWLEALAMLYYAGEGEQVRGEWIDALLDLQREDGGWPNHPDAARSHPHPSALALWVLLERLSPEPASSWIPGR